MTINALVLAFLLPLTLHTLVIRHSSFVIQNNRQTLIDEHFNRAVELQRRGDLKAAEAEYRAVLAVSPRYAEAHANLGAVLMRLDRYDEAVTSYETALRLAPALLPVRLNLGIAHYRRAEFEKAVESLRNFLQSSSDNLQARQLLGLALVELGRDSEAVEYLSEAVSRSPDNPAVLYGLGLASLRLHKPELQSIIERLAAVTGGVAASHLLRGQAFLSGSEFERAVIELENALKLKPDLPRLHYSLGLSYLKLGRNKEALPAFENELRRAPRDFSTLYYLAYLNEAEGNFKVAFEKLRMALAIDPDSAEGNALLGKLLIKEGNTAGAVKYLELAVTRDPVDTDKRYLLARAYQELGRREDAARQFEEIQRRKKEQLEKDRERHPKN